MHGCEQYDKNATSQNNQSDLGFFRWSRTKPGSQSWGIIWALFKLDFHSAASTTKWCKLSVLCQGGGACPQPVRHTDTPTLILCSADCMHAGTAASPQQSSHVQQHGTECSAPGRTMVRPEDQQTASSRTLDEALKPLKYLQRCVLLLLCRVIAGWWGGGGGYETVFFPAVQAM